MRQIVVTGQMDRRRSVATLYLKQRLHACQCHMFTNQCPEEIRELEGVLEEDEVDEDKHQPWAVEPEQLV